MRGLDNCLREGLLTGVATSLCQSNIDELLTEEWLGELIKRGVHYAWYHTYRPVGPKPNFDLALRPDQLVRVRKFVVEMRAKLPIAIIDAYYDGAGQALCPMSTGVSHHIGPKGDIEPCPIIQFAKESIYDESRTLGEKIMGSEFLRELDDRTWLDAAPRVDVVADAGRGGAESLAFAVEVSIDDGDRFLSSHLDHELADLKLLFWSQAEIGRAHV